MNKIENNIQSFRPVINNNSELIILGTIPGKISLGKQEYYGNKRNHFWKIISAILNEKFPNNYENKKSLLLKNKIALWDVIADCERQGSLDSNIKEENVNDFISLLKNYPRITKIFFNGKKAYTSFRKNVGFSNPSIEYIGLPSTSPANTIGINEKIKLWRKIVE